MGNAILNPNKVRLGAGKRLKKAMNKRRLSVNALSQLTELSPGTIYHFLSGERDMHLDDLQVLSRVLNVKPSWLAWG